MAELFVKILNMSISAGWLILLVVLLRLLFRKMPKWIMVLLWGIVGLRLLLPVSRLSLTEKDKSFYRIQYFQKCRECQY